MPLPSAAARPPHRARSRPWCALLLAPLLACAGPVDGAVPGDGAAAATAADARVDAWASGTVEVFVNGASAGRGAGAGATVTIPASLLAGGDNAIVVRATGGGAAAPSLRAEVQGAFGRAGTSARWKVKAASASEATAATGDWAQAGYDDSAWSTAVTVSTPPPAGFPSGGPSQGIWTAGKDATVLARLVLYVPAGLDAGVPQGFGRGVTGGAGGAVVRPSTLAELAAALCASRSGGTCTDATPRVVEISREFDFTGSEGTNTKKGCHAYSVCPSPMASEILMDEASCASAGKPLLDVTYDVAATNPLLVGSNKTLLGVGSGARLKGKGVAIRGGVSNVVVRNVTITELNPQVVWGGDAITIDDADRVWIDHDRISLVGRQMLVTGWGKASNVTVSWTEFDGQTPYAAYCDGAHYWVSLNLGKGDTITMVGNWFHHTSGRGPHVGGYAGVDALMHLVDNQWEQVPGHAINPISTGAPPQARVVAEANHFAGVTQPVFIDATYGAGLVYAPASDAAECQGALGRPCLANVASPVPSSGWPPPLDAAALTSVGDAYAGRAPAPFPAAEVPHAVPHLAGVGHVGAAAGPAPDSPAAASPAAATARASAPLQSSCATGGSPAGAGALLGLVAAARGRRRRGSR